MKKLMFIATGGTIASGDSGGGLTPEASAEELLSGIRVTDAEVHAVQPFALDSTNLTPQHWTELATLIRDCWQDYDGFVVTHGTDTMAYGAAALSCLIQDAGKPIILTGSQLPMSDPDTDARRNLTDAFLCAQRGRAGVWVSFCGRVIAGNAARKVHTRDFDAFQGFTPEDEFTTEGFLTDAAPDEVCTAFYNRLEAHSGYFRGNGAGNGDVRPGAGHRGVRHGRSSRLRRQRAGAGSAGAFGVRRARDNDHAGVPGRLRPFGVRGGAVRAARRRDTRRGHDYGIRGHARNVGTGEFLRPGEFQVAFPRQKELNGTTDRRTT